MILYSYNLAAFPWDSFQIYFQNVYLKKIEPPMCSPKVVVRVLIFWKQSAVHIVYLLKIL